MMDDPKYQTGEPPVPPDDGDVVVSPDTHRPNRIPPGQSRTRKWPVLHAGAVPRADLARWTLLIRGLLPQPVSLTWADFQRLPRVNVFADMHCVTRWTRLGNLWQGVSTRTVLNLAGGPLSEARYVLVHAEQGWTTNLPLDDFLADDALFADRHDAEPLPPDHGGPLRLVVPRLYAWKSAKWVRGIELLEHDRPGFWEQGGYHMRGDPWQQQRFR